MTTKRRKASSPRANEMRCLAGDIIIELMNDKQAGHLELIKMHVVAALQKLKDDGIKQILKPKRKK